MRHHQIEPDDLEVRLAIERLECLDAIERERDPERPLLELHLDDAAHVRLVVDNEHVSAVSGYGCGSCHTREAMLARWRRRSYKSAHKCSIGCTIRRRSASAETGEIRSR